MMRLRRLPFLILALSLPLSLPAQPQSGSAADEEPTVIGIEQARSGGGYLGFNVEGNAFVLRFYDEEKKEIEPDAIRALARWNHPRQPGQQRTVLTASGTQLRSPSVARPPHAYVVYLTLIGPDENVIESVSFNARTLPE